MPSSALPPDDLSDFEGECVLVFTASVEEIRKAAALFGKTVRLTAEGGGA